MNTVIILNPLKNIFNSNYNVYASMVACIVTRIIFSLVLIKKNNLSNCVGCIKIFCFNDSFKT